MTPRCAPPTLSSVNKWRLALSVGAVCLVLLSWRLGLFSLLAEPERLRSTLLEMGGWGYVVYLVAFAFLSPFGLPGIGFVIGATYVWPRPIAYALSVTGALLCSTVGFFFARFIARDWVSAKMPPRLRRYDTWIEKRGWLAAAGLRAVFLMHPLLHALFGISRIRFIPYILGCALGYIPSLAVVVWVSGSALDYLREQPRERYFLIGGVLLALVLLRRAGKWLWKRRKRAQVSVEPTP